MGPRTHRSRRTRLTAPLLALALIVAACGGDEDAPPDDADAAPEAPSDAGDDPEPSGDDGPSGDPITMAVSLPLTGEFSVPGSKHQDGYQFCVDEINARGGLLDRPVELLVTDNRSDSEVGVTQYERFINVDNADLLLGTFSSLLTFPVSVVAEQAGMVFPVPSGGALRIWERGFENLFYFQQAAAEFIGIAPAEMLIEYRDSGLIAEEDFPTTAAVVNADDFFAAAIANGLVGGEVAIPGTDEVVDLSPGYLAENGIEVVHTEEWPADYTGWIQLANSIANSGAEALFVGTASPEEAIELIRAMQTVGYQPDFVYMSQGTQSEFGAALGDGAQGITAQSAWHPEANFPAVLGGEDYSNQDFISGFEESYGRPPDEDEAIPFASCQGLEQAVRATGTTDNAVLREWLHGRTVDDAVSTIMGDFSWDDRGLPIDRAHIMTQWQDGQLNFVYPTDEFPGVVDLIYPKPEW